MAHREVGIAKSDRLLRLRRVENHTGVVITNLAIVSLDEGYFPFNSAKYDASLQFPHARRRGRQSEIAIGPSILSGGSISLLPSNVVDITGAPACKVPPPDKRLLQNLQTKTTAI